MANEAELVGENEDVDGEGEAPPPPPEPPMRGLPSLTPPLLHTGMLFLATFKLCTAH